MKLTLSQLKRLISESMEGVSERDQFMINLLVNNLSSLSNAMPDEIDAGLQGSFMNIHVETFKDLEKDGFISNFVAYDKGYMFPETITFFFFFDRQAAATYRAILDYCQTHPDVYKHPRANYVYVQVGFVGKDCSVTYMLSDTSGMTVHVSKPGHAVMEA